MLLVMTGKKFRKTKTELFYIIENCLFLYIAYRLTNMILLYREAIIDPRFITMFEKVTSAFQEKAP